MYTSRRIGALTLALALITLGCDDGKSNNNDQDTSTDTVTDTTADTATDADDDTATDPGTDPTEDPTEDPTTDPSTDETTDDGVEPVYPTAVGEWEAFYYDQENGDLLMHFELTLTDSTMEQLMFQPTSPTTEDLLMGIRADYAITGETALYTLTEATLDGTTWFTETSDATAWADFVANEMGGVENWSATFAVAITGEIMFTYTDDFENAEPMVWSRTGGTAVPAVGYPSYEGDWQSVVYELGATDPSMRFDVSVEATTLQTDFFGYSTGWTYMLGMRADYVLDGHEQTETFTELTSDGVTWFTETSNPTGWADLISASFGGHESYTNLWGISPTGEHMFAASTEWSGVLQTIMYNAI